MTDHLSFSENSSKRNVPSKPATSDEGGEYSVITDALCECCYKPLPQCQESDEVSIMVDNVDESTLHIQPLHSKNEVISGAFKLQEDLNVYHLKEQS